MAPANEVIISPEVSRYTREVVEVTSKTVQTKHPESEPDLPAYIVKAWKDKDTAPWRKQRHESRRV